LTDHQS
jgi:pectin methylesterase-like acyl-CoA thioesterase